MRLGGIGFANTQACFSCGYLPDLYRAMTTFFARNTPSPTTAPTHLLSTC